MKSRLVDTLEFYSREKVSYATISGQDSTFIISQYFYNYTSKIIFEEFSVEKGKKSTRYKSFLFEDNIKLQKAWLYVTNTV